MTSLKGFIKVTVLDDRTEDGSFVLINLSNIESVAERPRSISHGPKSIIQMEDGVWETDETIDELEQKIKAAQ